MIDQDTRAGRDTLCTFEYNILNGDSRYELVFFVFAVINYYGDTAAAGDLMVTCLRTDIIISMLLRAIIAGFFGTNRSFASPIIIYLSFVVYGSRVPEENYHIAKRVYS